MSTAKLKEDSFLYLVMDARNVNWDVLNKHDNKLFEDGFSKTLNIGSYVQHVVHGAYQTGSSNTGSNLEKILKVIVLSFPRFTSSERNLKNCFRDRYISFTVVLKIHLFSSVNVFKFCCFLEFTLVTNNQIKLKNWLVLLLAILFDAWKFTQFLSCFAILN